MRGFHKLLNVVGPVRRAAMKKTPPLPVGRGPVPRHAAGYPTLAGDRPPRYDEKTLPLPVGRGPVPRHAAGYPTLAGDRPPRYGKIKTRRSLLQDASRPGGLSYGGKRFMKHPQLNRAFNRPVSITALDDNSP